MPLIMYKPTENTKAPETFFGSLPNLNRAERFLGFEITIDPKYLP